MNQPVFLFPGHGGYLPGGLREFTDDFAGLPSVLERINAASSAAGGPGIADLLTDRTAPTLRSLVDDDPGRLHLAMFATEMCVHDIYTRCWGLSPALLMGHGFGEFAALVAAGCLSLEDGVRLVVARDEALRKSGAPKGGMVELRTGRQRAGLLLEGLAGHGGVLAVDNGADQVVVSGPSETLRRLKDLAAATNVEATELHVPYPFHNAMLDEAASLFAAVVDTVTCHAPRTPVHSPVLGRRVERPADVRAVLARHLVSPVGFLDALRTLSAQGHHIYVECGAKAVLTNLVRSAQAEEPRVLTGVA
ncbi:Malonyl CoA-acyl carrier protein transacylase [Lentzea xinjiangensis]|uniref:[acyl-carrier-protein] S-malonyltransferase n=1 Tax=Lentzea xinjiangensis TaxID=402600 RepID=A0A1H9WFU5_9PSEU|nr:acyltransferase domain-containing protein [Lentzea xinjiangensis]SES32567.1 Malonyl CoA-acyl carrier protein transacylase [Lentzea xinjiangensis]